MAWDTTAVKGKANMRARQVHRSRGRYRSDRRRYGPTAHRVRQKTAAFKGLATSSRIYHFRDRERAAAGFVLGRKDGQTTGVEVKASMALKPQLLHNRHKPTEAMDASFVCGVVLCDGEQATLQGDHNYVAPLRHLWDSLWYGEGRVTKRLGGSCPETDSAPPPTAQCRQAIECMTSIPGNCAAFAVLLSCKGSLSWTA